MIVTVYLDQHFKTCRTHSNVSDKFADTKVCEWLVGWMVRVSKSCGFIRITSVKFTLDKFYFSKCFFFLSNTRQLINLRQQYNYTQFKIMVHVSKKKWTFQLLNIRIETDWSSESLFEYQMHVGYVI